MAGPRTRPRRRRGRALVGRDPELRRPADALGPPPAAPGPASAAAGARRSGEPGEREAVGAAPVGRRLGGEGRDSRRDHDQPQRPVEQPEHQPADPGRRQRAERRRAPRRPVAADAAPGESGDPGEDQRHRGRARADRQRRRAARRSRRRASAAAPRRAPAATGPRSGRSGARGGKSAGRSGSARSRRSRQNPIPDRPRRVGDLVGRRRRASRPGSRPARKTIEVGELPVDQEDQPDDRDDAAVDLGRVVAQRRADVAAHVVAAGRKRVRRQPAAPPRRSRPRQRRLPAAGSRERPFDPLDVPAVRAGRARAGRRADTTAPLAGSRTRAVATTVRAGPFPAPDLLHARDGDELEVAARRRHRRAGARR